jgi:hypothetical protein
LALFERSHLSKGGGTETSVCGIEIYSRTIDLQARVLCCIARSESSPYSGFKYNEDQRQFPDHGESRE